MTYYNNLPQEKITDSSQSTIQVFDAYRSAPLSIDGSVFDVMIGFFESRGFGSDSAKSISYIIIKQATIDKLNPIQILESLKGMDSVQISDLVMEILNYNRFKTSSLGVTLEFTALEEVSRNILA